MAWQFSLYLLPNFVAGAAAVGLAAYAWRKRGQRTAGPFVAMMVGLAVWALAYGVELGFSTVGPMLRWDQVAFVGSVLVPTAWFLLALEYAGYEEWITRRTLGSLAVEPALTLALVWTNGLHGLIWRSASVDASGPIAVPALEFGPAYWVNFAYSYLLIVAGLVLVASVVPRAGRIHRRQSVVLLAGVSVPLGANVVFHLVPAASPFPNLDLTPFLFVATGLLYALALFRFRMLELVPTARETLVSSMDDGIVVADAEGQIVDVNPAAGAALGDVVGRPVGSLPLGDPGDGDRSVVEIQAGDESRTYEVSSTTMTDFRSDVVGRFLHLRDVTQLQVLREHEQRLSVLNRILRHNLRNELNVVAGESELLAESYEGEGRRRAVSIHEAADRMLDIAEKARHVETTIGSGRSGSGPVDVAAVVDDVAGRLDDAFSAATVRVDVPEAALATRVSRHHVRVAVENLGENAIEHNPSSSPTVRFRVERSEGEIRVSVADDGPGIPEIELTALDRDRETPLQHGSGVGLWLVRWIVDASGGELTVESREPAGSVVTLVLPRADESGGAGEDRGNGEPGAVDAGPGSDGGAGEGDGRGGGDQSRSR